MIFGMMAAISQDLPAIYDFAQYKASKNSEVLDDNGEVIGTLTSDQNKILLSSSQISPNVKNAVVSIEDARFYEHNGVDFRGIGRALVSDIVSGSAQQGASTITEQFVKNALEAEGSRTVLEKFREAALAYRLEKHWSKEKILTEYLNTIYFGEGAYGIEAAARTYFGAAHPGCGTPTEPCASVLDPWEAATLAGIIASPSAFDPKAYPENALGRTLDLQLQEAAEEAVGNYLGYSPATASVVVIDNRNAGIKAMVGGPDFATKPFNLATQGHRQPGSSIKPFTLITALEEGISPETVYPSEQRTFHFGKHGKETFEVSNDEDSYLGSCSIICATTYSDNSIYAALGLEGLEGKTVEDRTRSIASTAHKAGYDDPISTNPAMVLGGLKEGVTPLGWAYAYSTIGNNGDRVSGTLAPRPGDSPVAFTEVTNNDGDLIKGGDNDSIHTQVFDQEKIEEAKSILETVVAGGTGTNAQIGAEGQWGKTGTTENNGDAWFCGGIGDEVTACVWVGYPDSTTPMTTLYNGGPVMGGTFPALIWASVISAWRDIQAEHAAERAARKAAKGEDEGGGSGESGESSEYEYEAPETEGESESEYEAPVEPEAGGEAEPGPVETPEPEEAAPEEATPEPAPEEAAPAGGGGGVTAG
jgi:membrane peptidoglycan carboxypeptidase